MARACSTRRKKADPVLRKYTLTTALTFAAAGLMLGFYFGYGMVTEDVAAGSPIFEKIFLTTFISFSCAAAGLIFGGYLGSTIYRLLKKHGGQACPPDNGSS